MKYNTKLEGWKSILKPYQAGLLEQMISQTEKDPEFSYTSGQADIWQEPIYGKSRASIIFSLNDMVDEGILAYIEKTGKGGHHRVYRMAMSRQDVERFIIAQILNNLKKNWPGSFEEMYQVMKS